MHYLIFLGVTSSTQIFVLWDNCHNGTTVNNQTNHHIERVAHKTKEGTNFEVMKKEQASSEMKLEQLELSTPGKKRFIEKTNESLLSNLRWGNATLVMS